MGNEISASNSIAYYQKEIFGEEKNNVPIFRLPKIRLMENHEIEDTSLVVLFYLDNDKDGYASPSDLEAFVKGMQDASMDPNDSDFGFSAGAFCTEYLCKSVSSNGIESLRAWVSKAIDSSFTVSTNDGIGFIDGDAVKRIYDILQIEQLLGRNFQWVFDMLQRHAEANLKMNLNDPAFDDLVPVETVLCLVQQIAEGMMESYNVLTSS